MRLFALKSQSDFDADWLLTLEIYIATWSFLKITCNIGRSDRRIKVNDMT